jgi:hypothetical protein
MRSLSLEAPITPLGAASILESIVVNDCESFRPGPRAYPVLENDRCSDIGVISMPRKQTTELESYSVHTSGISKRPISQTSITDLFNYERQCMDTVSHTMDQFSPHRSVRNLTADCIPVQVPTQQYDKSRRVLSLPTVSSVLNVSMRGAFDVVDVISLRFKSTASSCVFSRSVFVGIGAL